MEIKERFTFEVQRSQLTVIVSEAKQSIGKKKVESEKVKRKFVIARSGATKQSIGKKKVESEKELTKLSLRGGGTDEAIHG